MKELTTAFEEETAIQCEIILGSSGLLSAQIKAGAPYHIFVSANMKYPQEIFENDLTITKPAIYAYGVLVLWTRGTSVSLHDLVNDSFQKIAIANPSTAPYGDAAINALKKSNLLDQLSDKLVYGESISQVNQFILSNAVDAGFTSKSVVVSRELRDIGQWTEVDQSLYNPVEQGIILIKGDHESEARRFFDFILSEKGQAILIANGYKVN